MEELRPSEREIEAAVRMAVGAGVSRVRVIPAHGEPVVVALSPHGRRQKGLRSVLATEDWIGVDALGEGDAVVDRYRRDVHVVEEPPAVLPDPGTPALPPDRDGQLVAAMVHAQRAVLAPLVQIIAPVLQGYTRLLEVLQARAEGAEVREVERLAAERAALEVERAALEQERAAREDDDGVAAALAPVVAQLPTLLAGRGEKAAGGEGRS